MAQQRFLCPRRARQKRREEDRAKHGAREGAAMFRFSGLEIALRGGHEILAWRQFARRNRDRKHDRTPFTDVG